MRRLSIRWRLTLLVTSVFVVALFFAGTIARQRLEATLVSTARDNATQTLAESFFPIEVVDGDTTFAIDGITRFVFTDVDGNELGQDEFAALINLATAEQLAELGFFVESGAFAVDVGPITAEEAELLEFDEAVLESMTEFQSIVPIGEPVAADTADDIVVEQLARIGDEELTISVATPRQPLDDSLDAFTYLGLALIPMLGAGVALATWLTATRVLRPVEDIRRQVEQTDAVDLGQHVPRSGNGDEIDRLAGTMNDMLDRLQAASIRQRQFISDASHELRSPITATLATLETTDASDVAGQWPDISSTLTTEQERLAHLVDDLLLMATLDEAQSGPTFQPVDLDELILAEAKRPHGVEIQATVDQPHRVNGSSGLLQRCIGNLVENAARHATSKVDITVSTTQAGEAVVRVDDDGPGVPADRLETIFERFTRIDDARNRRQGGAGLGLSIARGIAQQHGATLSASNRPEGGARFEIIFVTGDNSAS